MSCLREVGFAISVVIVLLVMQIIVAADPILAGSVSFNPLTNLYTYNYTLDNRSGPARINELSIRINSIVRDFNLSPNAHSDPPSWLFVTAISGSSELPPLSMFGTFWQWGDISGGLEVGSTLSGFSFTTNVSPTLSFANNYFIYSTSYAGGPPGFPGVVEYGHIVAPDLGTGAPIPEPATLVLLGMGMISIVGKIMARRRREHPNRETE